MRLTSLNLMDLVTMSDWIPRGGSPGTRLIGWLGQSRGLEMRGGRIELALIFLFSTGAEGLPILPTFRTVFLLRLTPYQEGEEIRSHRHDTELQKD